MALLVEAYPYAFEYVEYDDTDSDSDDFDATEDAEDDNL